VAIGAARNPKYRGNYAPQIARNVILQHSVEGDTILDSVVGSGTMASFGFSILSQQKSAAMTCSRAYYSRAYYSVDTNSISGTVDGDRSTCESGRC